MFTVSADNQTEIENFYREIILGYLQNQLEK